MTPTLLVTPEVQSLIEAVCDGMADDAQVCKLESLLLSDVEARNFYVDFLDFDVKLQRLAGSLQEGEASLQEFISTQQAPPRHLAPSFLSTAYHGTIGFFSHELPFSMLIGTVLTGLGLWFASMVYVSSPDKIARDSSSLPSKTTFDPTLKVVGKITGMDDCKWADPQTETFNGANVLLGRKYALASGLMEITYDTGAKVILQGPVTYEVEANGGYLSLGKLTGKLEKKVASGQWPVASKERPGGRGQGLGKVASGQWSVASEASPKSQNPEIPKSPISNPQSQIPNPFCIRTPNAVVTDLGTEFGVEVDRVGNTATQVYQGTVEVQSIKAGTVENSPLRLSQGDAAKVEAAQNSSPTVHRAPFKADGFTRQMPAPEQIAFFRDTFDSSSVADKWGDAKEYGLNECLLERQSGVSGLISYFRGGCYNASNRNKTLVNPPEAPGKLCLLADYGEGGWVVLNRRFPRNVIVSAELNPMAVHWLDKSNPKVFSRDQTSSSWIALGIRGGSLALESPYLPLASSAGEVFAIHADGLWEYFEHGERIIGGRVLPSRPYRVAMCVVGERLRITVNEISLQLDPNDPNGWRKLRGWCRDNYVSIGVGNAVCFGGSLATRHDPEGRDLSTIDNLTIVPPGRDDCKPIR